MYLKNRFLQIGFSKESQGGIISIRNLTTNQDFISAKGVKEGKMAKLWEIKLRDKKGRRYTINNRIKGEFSYSNNETKDGSILYLNWKFSLNNAEKEIEVKVKVRVPAYPSLSYWNIEVKNNSEYCILTVFFPLISGIGAISNNPDNDCLILPWWGGLLIHNPIKAVSSGYGGKSRKKFQYAYPGCYTMQFSSYYNENNGGIYLAVYDGNGYYKKWAFCGEDGNCLSYRLENFPEDIKRNYSMPYEAVIGVFHGDWSEAAKIYQEWAIRQRWCSKGLLKDRKDIPEWAKDIALWWTNWVNNRRCNPEDIVPSAVKLQKYIGLPLAIHWYGWSKIPFAYYPIVFSYLNKDWEDSLKKGIRKLHLENIHAIPYTDPRIWYKVCKNEEMIKWVSRKINLKPYIDKYIAWNPKLQKWNPNLRWNAMQFMVLCPHTSFSKKYYFKTVEKIIDTYDFDGVYTDQVPVAYPVPCFDSRHHHPLGGGNYWYKGYKNMMENIRSRIKKAKPELIFTTESCGELYIDVFDVFLTLDISSFERLAVLRKIFSDYSEPIPLFNSVYHQYAMTYSGFSQFKSGYHDQFALELGRDFSCGSQPILEGFFQEHLKDRKFADDLKFLKEIVQNRNIVKDYLGYGEFMGFLKLDVPLVKVKCESRFNNEFYLEKREKDFIRKTPAVLSSIWKAEDGSIGLFFVNITDLPVKIKYELDINKYGFNENRFTIYRIMKNGKNIKIGNYNAPKVVREENIHGKSTYMLILKG